MIAHVHFVILEIFKDKATKDIVDKTAGYIRSRSRGKIYDIDVEDISDINEMYPSKEKVLNSDWQITIYVKPKNEEETAIGIFLKIENTKYNLSYQDVGEDSYQDLTDYLEKLMPSYNYGEGLYLPLTLEGYKKSVETILEIIDKIWNYKHS